MRDLSLASRAAMAIFAALVAACAQAPVKATASTDKPQLDGPKYAAMLSDARALIDHGHPGEAITKDLDPVIAAYDAAYAGSKATVYSSRWLTETIYYMAISATQGARVDGDGGPSAIAIDQVWGAALYMKGFALVELHLLPQAHESLERAVRLSPKNSQYLSELGQLHQSERDWQKALSFYRQAADAAELSPPAVKDKELTRAWRGIAFVDVETGRFDEAISLYERCLALNRDDKMAARELGYARAQQAKQATR